LGTGMRFLGLLLSAELGFILASLLPLSVAPWAFPALLLSGLLLYTLGWPGRPWFRARDWAERSSWLLWGIGLGIGLAALLVWAIINLPGVSDFMNNLDA